MTAASWQLDQAVPLIKTRYQLELATIVFLQIISVVKDISYDITSLLICVGYFENHVILVLNITCPTC